MCLCDSDFHVEYETAERRFFYAMSFDAFSRAYRKAVAEKISTLERDICQGKADSYAAYKDMTGVRNGLEYALRVFQETMRKFAEESDDDE